MEISVFVYNSFFILEQVIIGDLVFPWPTLKYRIQRNARLPGNLGPSTDSCLIKALGSVTLSAAVLNMVISEITFLSWGRRSPTPCTATLEGRFPGRLEEYLFALASEPGWLYSWSALQQVCRSWRRIISHLLNMFQILDQYLPPPQLIIFNVCF